MAEEQREEASAEETARRAVSAGWARERVGSGMAWANGVLERYRGRVVPDIALGWYERDRESAGTLVGSALALRLFLFFMPFVVFVLGIGGFLRTWFRPDDVTRTSGLQGGLAGQLGTALEQPNTTRWTAVALGLFGVILTGRTLTKVLVAASCLAWRMPVRTKVPFRVVGTLIGLMSAVGLISILVSRVQARAGIGVASVSLGVAFVVYAGLWLVLSLPLPRITPDPGCLVPGAVLIGATIAGMQAISQLYLPGQFEHASELYGALGLAIATLGWFFVLGRGIILALALDAAVYARLGSITEALLSLPVLRRLPERSAWVRRLLEAQPEQTPPTDADAPRL